MFMSNLFSNHSQRKAALLPLLLTLMTFFAGCHKREKAWLRPSADNLEDQVFCLTAGGTGIFTGKKGTILAVPAHAFLDENGQAVEGDIELHLREARDMKDMVQAGLQTVSDKGILQTDGSYLIEAFQSGKKLRLDPSAGMYAWFPTMKKDKEMSLYLGSEVAENVTWSLDQDKEAGPVDCDASKESRAKCKRCEKLARLSKRIHTGKKPDPNKDYWAKRYYMENGKMYFYSSGGSEELFTQKQLEECRKYLQSSAMGREFLDKVATLQQTQRDKAADYYSFRLNTLGWYNIDRLMKEQSSLVSFHGKIVDDDGKPVPGATVHFISGTRKIHVMTTAADGSYRFEFIPHESFRICAYRGEQAGKEAFTVTEAGQELMDLRLARMKPEEVEYFLSDLM